MAIVRIMNMLLKDKQVGKNVVPIVPDESRTFGMEGMFRAVGIWNQQGQNYVPEDHDQLMFYKESTTGQVLQEGINEAGAMSDWIAAATSYSVHGVQTIPFYICYSMFGLQRTHGPRLGGWRPARPRLPDRRHRRPHHAERRRPAARRRPQPDPVATGPELHLLRPDLPVRSRGHRPGRHAPHVRRAGRRLLLHHRDERELRAPGNAGRRRSRHHQGHVRLQEGRRRSNRAARAAARLRHHLPRSHRRRRPAQGTTGASKPTSGAARPSTNWPATARTPPAGTCSTRSKRRSSRTSSRSSAGADGPVVAATDYVKLFAEQIRPFVKSTLRHAGHRRLRSFRHPREAAPLLRGRSPLGDPGRPEGAGRRRQDRARARSPQRWSSTSLDPAKPNPMSV